MDWEAILNYLTQEGTAWGIKLLKAIIVLVVALRVIAMIKKWLKKSPKLDKLDPGFRTFLTSFVTIGLYILLVIIMATLLGIPATSLITILASCGVAVGLALQGALSNFAGGLMLLLFRPFKVGDYIETSGEAGTVDAITVVYTILLTTDNKRITIPNGSLTNTVIRNYSAEELRRVDLEFNTAYSCDMERVKAVMLKLAEEHPLVLAEPAPMVRLAAHNDSALTYKMRVWCKNADYWTVFFDMTENVKKAFDENDISIPYPQVDVHLKNN